MKKNTKITYRKCWEEKHDCAFNKNGRCTLLNFTKFNLGCSFYKKNTEYDKEAVEKACKRYNPNHHTTLFSKPSKSKKTEEPKVYKNTVFGNDKTSNVLMDTLLSKGNVCISVKCYEDLIKKYGSEDYLIEILYKKYGMRFGVRFIAPEKKDNRALVSALNTYISEDDKGCYILEESK